MLPWPRERVSRHVRQAPRLAALGALVVLGALVIFDLLLAWALVRPSEKSRAISPLPSIALHAFHRADRVLSPASTSATGQAQRLLVRPPKHVIVVMEENHSYHEIIGSPQAPYINTLAREGAVITNSYANAHPSQPNYLDLFAGSTQGIATDTCLDRLSGPNLGSELLAAGRRFVAYAEDLPAVGSGACSNTSGTYSHATFPWVDSEMVPARDSVPFTRFPTDYTRLPTVAIVVPNLRHNMHSGSIRAADTWLRRHLGPYVRWLWGHNSLLIVQWDEDDGSPGNGNHIPTLFVGPMIRPGYYTVAGNSLRKTGTRRDWDASAISAAILTKGNGSVQVTADSTTSGRMVGLAYRGNGTQPSQVEASYKAITFAFELQSNGTLLVYEAGTLRAHIGSYWVGDVLRLAVKDGLVTYSRNGTVLYSSVNAPLYPLVAAASIRDPGGTLANAIFCGPKTCAPVKWIHLLKVRPVSNHFTILRTLEDMYDLPYAGESGAVTPITEIWRPMRSSTRR